MRRYQDRVPAVSKIIQAMVAKGLIETESQIENDHIAFRTLGVPHLGVASLEKIFLHLGYVRRDPYFFAEKRLNAFWYAPPDPSLPRIFISELRVEDLSPNSQRIIHSYTDTVKFDPVDQLDLDDGEAIDTFLHAPLWDLPTWDEYQLLQKESEYAAWTIYNRYYLNHFTISVHSLPEGYHTVELYNHFLESIGIALNNAGGKRKVSPDGLLIQSSTVAEMVDGAFRTSDGLTSQRIAGSYVEFAERRVLPQYLDLPPDRIRREHRRDGFEAQNADKIFESTYSSQTTRDA